MNTVRLERRATSLEFALATPAEGVEHLVHTAGRRQILQLFPRGDWAAMRIEK